MNRQMSTLGVLVVMGLAILPVVSSAQTADLAMTDFTAAWDGTTLTLSAQVTVSTHGSFETIDTEVAFYLDSVHIGSVPLLVEPDLIGSCHQDTPPDCGGYCEAIYIDGVRCEPAGCAGLTWPVTGPQCCCLYVIPAKQYLTPYHGESMASGTVDPMGVHAEGDETNNTMSVSLEPIVDEARTWSQVKALYR